MTDQELDQLRRDKWRLNGHPVRTLEDARAFIESVGFCLLYPVKQPVLVPTFIGAWAGSDERLPTWQHAFSDPRSQDATDLMVRLLREHAAYEANLIDQNNAFLVVASIFPYFYALVGECNLELIRREGPISQQKMRDVLGGSISLAALDHALSELWSKLRITRVDYNPAEGAFWDVLYRWAPDAVREGISLSVGEALSALISKYLDCVIAADQQEIESFFGNFVPRSRVKEAVNALLVARELSFVHVGNRSLVQITPAKVEPIVRPPEHLQRSRPPRTSTSRRR